MPSRASTAAKVRAQKVLPEPTLSPDARCPSCGSPNLEQDDPFAGLHTCRDCGEECSTAEAERAS
jgi:hypothetical protein